MDPFTFANGAGRRRRSSRRVAVPELDSGDEDGSDGFDGFGYDVDADDVAVETRRLSRHPSDSLVFAALEAGVEVGQQHKQYDALLSSTSATIHAGLAKVAEASSAIVQRESLAELEEDLPRMFYALRKQLSHVPEFNLDVIKEASQLKNWTPQTVLAMCRKLAGTTQQLSDTEAEQRRLAKRVADLEAQLHKKDGQLAQVRRTIYQELVLVKTMKVGHDPDALMSLFDTHEDGTQFEELKRVLQSEKQRALAEVATSHRRRESSLEIELTMAKQELAQERRRASLPFAEEPGRERLPWPPQQARISDGGGDNDGDGDGGATPAEGALASGSDPDATTSDIRGVLVENNRLNRLLEEAQATIDLLNARHNEATAAAAAAAARTERRSSRESKGGPPRRLSKGAVPASPSGPPPLPTARRDSKPPPLPSSASSAAAAVAPWPDTSSTPEEPPTASLLCAQHVAEEYTCFGPSDEAKPAAATAAAAAAAPRRTSSSEDPAPPERAGMTGVAAAVPEAAEEPQSLCRVTLHDVETTSREAMRRARAALALPPRASSTRGIVVFATSDVGSVVQAVSEDGCADVLQDYPCERCVTAVVPSADDAIRLARAAVLKRGDARVQAAVHEGFVHPIVGEGGAPSYARSPAVWEALRMAEQCADRQVVCSPAALQRVSGLATAPLAAWQEDAPALRGAAALVDTGAAGAGEGAAVRRLPRHTGRAAGAPALAGRASVVWFCLDGVCGTSLGEACSLVLRSHAHACRGVELHADDVSVATGFSSPSLALAFAGRTGLALAELQGGGTGAAWACGVALSATLLFTSDAAAGGVALHYGPALRTARLAAEAADAGAIEVDAAEGLACHLPLAQSLMPQGGGVDAGGGGGDPAVLDVVPGRSPRRFLLASASLPPPQRAWQPPRLVSGREPTSADGAGGGWWPSFFEGPCVPLPARPPLHAVAAFSARGDAEAAEAWWGAVCRLAAALRGVVVVDASGGGGGAAAHRGTCVFGAESDAVLFGLYLRGVSTAAAAAVRTSVFVTLAPYDFTVADGAVAATPATLDTLFGEGGCWADGEGETVVSTRLLPASGSVTLAEADKQALRDLGTGVSDAALAALRFRAVDAGGGTSRVLPMLAADGADKPPALAAGADVPQRQPVPKRPPLRAQLRHRVACLGRFGGSTSAAAAAAFGAAVRAAAAGVGGAHEFFWAGAAGNEELRFLLSFASVQAAHACAVQLLDAAAQGPWPAGEGRCALAVAELGGARVLGATEELDALGAVLGQCPWGCAFFASPVPGATAGEVPSLVTGGAVSVVTAAAAHRCNTCAFALPPARTSTTVAVVAVGEKAPPLAAPAGVPHGAPLDRGWAPVLLRRRTPPVGGAAFVYAEVRPDPAPTDAARAAAAAAAALHGGCVVRCGGKASGGVGVVFGSVAGLAAFLYASGAGGTGASSVRAGACVVRGTDTVWYCGAAPDAPEMGGGRVRLAARLAARAEAGQVLLCAGAREEAAAEAFVAAATAADRPAPTVSDAGRDELVCVGLAGTQAGAHPPSPLPPPVLDGNDSLLPFSAASPPPEGSVAFLCVAAHFSRMLSQRDVDACLSIVRHTLLRCLAAHGEGGVLFSWQDGVALLCLPHALAAAAVSLSVQEACLLHGEWPQTLLADASGCTVRRSDVSAGGDGILQRGARLSAAVHAAEGAWCEAERGGRLWYGSRGAVEACVELCGAAADGCTLLTAAAAREVTVVGASFKWGSSLLLQFQQEHHPSFVAHSEVWSLKPKLHKWRASVLEKPRDLCADAAECCVGAAAPSDCARVGVAAVLCGAGGEASAACRLLCGVLRREHRGLRSDAAAAAAAAGELHLAWFDDPADAVRFAAAVAAAVAADERLGASVGVAVGPCLTEQHAGRLRVYGAVVAGCVRAAAAAPPGVVLGSAECAALTVPPHAWLPLAAVAAEEVAAAAGVGPGLHVLAPCGPGVALLPRAAERAAAEAAWQLSGSLQPLPCPALAPCFLCFVRAPTRALSLRFGEHLAARGGFELERAATHLLATFGSAASAAEFVASCTASAAQEADSAAAAAVAPVAAFLEATPETARVVVEASGACRVVGAAAAALARRVRQLLPPSAAAGGDVDVSWGGRLPPRPRPRASRQACHAALQTGVAESDEERLWAHSAVLRLCYAFDGVPVLEAPRDGSWAAAFASHAAAVGFCAAAAERLGRGRRGGGGGGGALPVRCAVAAAVEASVELLAADCPGSGSAVVTEDVKESVTSSSSADVATRYCFREVRRRNDRAPVFAVHLAGGGGGGAAAPPAALRPAAFAAVSGGKKKARASAAAAAARVPEAVVAVDVLLEAPASGVLLEDMHDEAVAEAARLFGAVEAQPAEPLPWRSPFTRFLLCSAAAARGVALWLLLRYALQEAAASPPPPRPTVAVDFLDGSDGSVRESVPLLKGVSLSRVVWMLEQNCQGCALVADAVRQAAGGGGGGGGRSNGEDESAYVGFEAVWGEGCSDEVWTDGEAGFHLLHPRGLSVPPGLAAAERVRTLAYEGEEAAATAAAAAAAPTAAGAARGCSIPDESEFLVAALAELKTMLRVLTGAEAPPPPPSGGDGGGGASSGHDRRKEELCRALLATPEVAAADPEFLRAMLHDLLGYGVRAAAAASSRRRSSAGSRTPAVPDGLCTPDEESALGRAAEAAAAQPTPPPSSRPVHSSAPIAALEALLPAELLNGGGKNRHKQPTAAVVAAPVEPSKHEWASQLERRPLTSGIDRLRSQATRYVRQPASPPKAARGDGAPPRRAVSATAAAAAAVGREAKQEVYVQVQKEERKFRDAVDEVRKARQHAACSSLSPTVRRAL